MEKINNSMLCMDCKFWRKENEYFGTCTNPKVEVYGVYMQRSEERITEHIMTDREFGCVKGKERKNEK